MLSASRTIRPLRQHLYYLTAELDRVSLVLEGIMLQLSSETDVLDDEYATLHDGAVDIRSTAANLLALADGWSDGQ